MGNFKLTTAPLPASWRAANPEIAPSDLLTVDAITDGWARRMVGRAKRRFDLMMKKGGAIDDEEVYIDAACQPANLKGFCFVAADEIARDLKARGVKAKCVRIMPKEGSGDHYFTVVNKGKNSLIVDATWLQFALKAQPFVLAGTLDKLLPLLKKAKPTIDLADAYKTGLEVVDQWDAYKCFSKD